ncbi:MAG: GNAT family N-acetyltransferase [Rhizobacter sp.]|nr:GNAT family N-acetyltransferase [Ferruginibacter sp.]
MAFPVLHTPRLLLREIAGADIDKVFEGLSHPEVIKQYGVSFTTLESTKEQMDWCANMIKAAIGRCWAICAADSSIFYGVITLPFWKKEHRKAGLGYWLLPQFWRKGIVTEAAAKVIEYAFTQMNLHRIMAEVEDDNAGSIASLKKLRFVYEGTQRECEIKDGGFLNLEMYALLNSK